MLTYISAQNTKRVVAIKSVMRSKLNRRLLENLESEISILTSIKHPHITRLKECIKSKLHIHLIMEYCSMGDLAGFIKSRDKFAMNPATQDFAHLYPSPPGGGLNEVIVRHFLKQLASALQFLRAKQLIHRDLKPQNLLLSPAKYSLTPEELENEDENRNFNLLVGVTNLPILKIADFGFARELQVSSLAETLCGSPLYMAPEILRYEKYDAKADLWSLGTVLYEMIAGRPPFRASNHVDLLRKIEEGNDRIHIPSKTVASDEVRDLINGLLKRNPVERISFVQFFNHPAVQDDIPGIEPSLMVNHNRPSTPPRTATRRESAARSEGVTSSPSRHSVAAETSPYSIPPRRDTQGQGSAQELKDMSPPKYTSNNELELPFARPSPPQHASSARPSPETHRTSTPMVREHSKNASLRGVPIHAHAPLRQELGRAASTPMERHFSRDSTPPQSSPLVPQQYREHKQRMERDIPRSLPRDGIEQREKPQEQDVMQDYVVIDKLSVGVNELADQISASPRLSGPVTGSPLSNAALARRPSASSRMSSARPSSSGKQPAQPVSRSLEKRYSASPGAAASSALARALNMAPFKIWGMGSPQRYSPPQQSLPSGSYSTSPYHPGSVVPLGAGKPSNLSEEDQAVMNALESCASKGDVVYHFAMVKYSQLVPMAPSVPQGLGLLPSPDGGPNASTVDMDLTPEAIVVLSEQALVLFVKCISLLNKSMQIAGNWWNKTSHDPQHRSHAAEKINGAVQWIRQRFNEAMEKADYVRLKLKEAQGRLPTSHPSHPSNHPTSQATDSKGMAVEQDIFISPGVTAERLMFDRAIEMSRGAAVNELVGEDLDGCHMSYVTALKLVEAVLEVDEDDGNVDDEDRGYIENGKLRTRHARRNYGGITGANMAAVVVNIKNRVDAVKAKMELHSKRSSGIYSVPSSPVPAYSTPMHANTPPSSK